MSDILNRTDFTEKSHIALITGGSGSGKSAFAENLVLKATGRKPLLSGNYAGIRI